MLEQQAKSLAMQGYTKPEIATMLGVSRFTVKRLIKDRSIVAWRQQQEREPNEDTLIDGERLADRVERMKREGWERHLMELRNGNP